MEGAGLDYEKRKIYLPFNVGDKTLFRLSFEGLRCDADIFKNPALVSLFPPKAELKKEGLDVAYIYSCPLSRRFPKISFAESYIGYVDTQYRHLFVRIEGDFKQYLSRFKGKTLSTLRRKVDKVSSSCKDKPYFKIYSTPEEMEDFYETAEEISKKSYQHNLLKQGLPLFEEFRRRIVRQAAAEKMLGFILCVADIPVAYNLCPIYGEGVLLYDYTGYDPAYANYSPGTVLQFKIIEAAFQNDNIRIYDLCTGEGQHKDIFTDEYTLCGNVYFFPLRPKYIVIVYGKLFFDAVTEFFRGLFDRIGLKDKIKKFIRRRV